ncbi:uncharacterized protein LOC120685011 [Panicum virgatum]|uniref:uncharacterized protein LOC120685011 n=1 Tax=Panicum virgatum TaxID=38727 RepID=UPI0019D5450E|nr:uncharacterized protein LOC120685011 [Panicum virgatum]
MRLTKVLMDGGSSLNILYVNTLEVMGIPKANFCTETLTFEVVDWKGVYPAILGAPPTTSSWRCPTTPTSSSSCRARTGVITVSDSFEQAYISSREYYDFATTAANSAELGQLRATTAKCRPNPGKPSQAPAFVSTDETKLVAVNDADPTKTVRISSQLPAK